MNFRFEIISRVLICCFFLFFLSCSSNIRYSSVKAEKISNTSKHSSDKKSGIPPNEKRELIIRESESWLGTPYCWGGESQKCTDCSGFVMSVFKKAGFILPRTAEAQFDYSEKIDKDEAIAGDLVFFRKHSGISHVGIYYGNNTMIHASTTAGVIRQSLNLDYYKEIIAGFGRIPQLSD